MKRISFEKLSASGGVFSYQEQYEYIKRLLEAGKIKPVKASGLNGKSPALYREYWVLEKKKDYGELREELLYQLVPGISVDYYLAHPASYEEDRRWVLLLNTYLKKNREKLFFTETVNERSFEIWHREKFLAREQGKKILKRCKIEPAFLNTYETTEPLAYYSHTRQTPQNLLIIENKDTFYSMRKHLIDGQDEILGMKTGTLIYGGGKGIFRSFQDFDLCVEPYMKALENRIYYFGDLDYEGIGMYEGLAELFQKKWEILPFVKGYEMMLKKAEMVERLPDMKVQQNKNIRELFFSYFSKKTSERMKRLLTDGTYIPQEILNGMDW